MKALRITLVHFIPFLLTALLSSCTETIDIDLDSTYSRLIVKGSVTSDSIRHQVRLTTTSDYFSNQPAPPVSGALVELFFEDEQMLFMENPEQAGLYESLEAFRGEPGITYRLQISDVDVDLDGSREEYQAESTMPGGVELEGIELKYFPNPLAPGYQVLMYAWHPMEQRDRMAFRILKNQVLITNSLSSLLVFNDDLFDSGYLPGFPVGFLQDNNPAEALQSGDTVTLQLECIDQDYYDFIMDAQWEIVGNNPLFSGPPANVHTNLSGGARGIFTAYSILRASVIVE